MVCCLVCRAPLVVKLSDLGVIFTVGGLLNTFFALYYVTALNYAMRGKNNYADWSEGGLSTCCLHVPI